MRAQGMAARGPTVPAVQNTGMLLVCWDWQIPPLSPPEESLVGQAESFL